jgi:hypothetical protein
MSTSESIASVQRQSPTDILSTSIHDLTSSQEIIEIPTEQSSSRIKWKSLHIKYKEKLTELLEKFTTIDEVSWSNIHKEFHIWISLLPETFFNQDPVPLRNITQKSIKNMLNHNIIGKRKHSQTFISSQEDNSLLLVSEDVADDHNDGNNDIADVSNNNVHSRQATTISYTTDDIKAIHLSEKNGCKKFTKQECELFLKVMKKPGVHKSNDLGKGFDWTNFAAAWEYDAKLHIYITGNSSDVYQRSASQLQEHNHSLKKRI